MKKLNILVVDLIHNAPSRSVYRRLMFPSYVGIMPQAVSVWCQQDGHRVDYRIFTGPEDLEDLAGCDADLVFLSAFTFTAQLAYALSHRFRSRGIPTVLGGPHARSYPDDACRWFDYVLGMTDRETIRDIVRDAALHSGGGVHLSASSQPSSFPSVRERWAFIETVHRLPSLLKVVPMLSSFGCPYTCDFCVDAAVPHAPLDLEVIAADLRFVAERMRRPVVAWFDASFGVAFDSVMNAIESAVPAGRIVHFAECPLAVLTEPNVGRLKRNGFKMIMPGIESWFGFGQKSRTGSRTGGDKVAEVAERLNMVHRHIPQVQANFVLGLDCDAGDEPFRLTERFVDLAPGIYPSVSLLSAYGTSASANAGYAAEGRVIPFPYHLLRSTHVLNVVPKHYTWNGLYRHYLEILRHAFSPRAIYRRFLANPEAAPRWITLFLSLSIGGLGKIRALEAMLRRLDRDREFQAFVARETDRVPAFIVNEVRRDLGPLWEWLPDKSLSYTVSA